MPKWKAAQAFRSQGKEARQPVPKLRLQQARLRKERCLLTDKRKTRTVNIPLGKAGPSLREEMKKRIDTPEARAIYGKRMHIVEPVFGNLRHNKGLGRFTLRGKNKVNAQWLLFCCVHNAEKWAKAALAGLFPPTRRLFRQISAPTSNFSLLYPQKRLETLSSNQLSQAA